MLSPRKKKNVIDEFAVHKIDTGSPSVQIAILSRRIDELVRHLKSHPKDNHSRRGLLKMVARRRKFLNYILKRDEKLYKTLLKKLDLKK